LVQVFDFAGRRRRIRTADPLGVKCEADFDKLHTACGQSVGLCVGLLFGH
jgi:hypothetical protein